MLAGKNRLQKILLPLKRSSAMDVPGAVSARTSQTSTASPKAGNRTKRMLSALVALFLILSPYIFWTAASFAQTRPPQPGEALEGGGNGDLNNAPLSDGAKQTQSTAPTTPYNDPNTTLVQQAAEQNKNDVIQNVEEMLKGEVGAYNDTYLGLHQWFSDDWVSNLFSNIGQLIGKWLTELIDGWVADTVQFLTAFLRIFVLNPNIAVNGLNGGPFGSGQSNDDISWRIRECADSIYAIACDLLLLLFILCIWKYWAESAWRGGGNLMGSVGRLIFTAGLMLAWPTIYAFEIQITNEMIQFIYFNSADQVRQLDVALATAVKAGLLATAGGLAQAFAPVIGAVAGGAIGGGAGGMVLGTVGDVVSFAGLIIYLILGGVLIAEIIYILVLKAIQTALLTAQYMFAPIFLVFFATPDTENVTSGYVKSWIEVSLWTFVWVGLLRILVILLNSDFNPWGKIVMAVGVLQLMIQVPSFLARAQISPMSDFISAGLITGGLLSGFKALGGVAKARTGQLFDYMFNQQYAARGMEQSKGVDLASLPDKAANPELLTQARAAASGQPLPGKPNTGPNGDAPPAMRTAADGQVAHGLATLAGQQRQETDAERQAREQRERQAEMERRATLAQQANLAYQQANPGVTPPAATQPAAPVLNAARGPGMGNVAAGAAMFGTVGAMAGVMANQNQGYVDPLTARMVPNGQAAATDPKISDMLSGQELEFNKAQHGAAKSGIINPATEFNHAGYKFVQMKGAAVDARIYNGNSIGYSSGDNAGKNMLVGDGKGNLRHMWARKGATPEEVAHLVMAGGFTELFKDDSQAFDAAREAAIDAGEDGPKGLSERMGAGFMAYSGKSFKQTARAKQRFAQSLFKHAALGSEAYVSNKPGNAYTHYLRDRFGDWTAADDTWACHIMTDASSPASPWNPAYAPATESLFGAGAPITEPNRAAAANPYVMQRPAWQRKAAIPAVAKYVTEMAKAQYPNAPDIVLQGAIGRIASQVTNDEVDAAFAIQIESHGADVNAPTIQSVARLTAGGYAQDSTNAYHSLKNVVSVMSGGGGGVRRQTQQVLVNLTGGGSPPPTISPDQLRGVDLGRSPEQQVFDVTYVEQASSDQAGPLQRMDLPIGTQGSGPADVRTTVVGNNGGSNPVPQQFEINGVLQGGSSSGSAHSISEHQVLQSISGQLGSQGPLLRAEAMVKLMHDAGFKDEHIQMPQMVNLCEVAQRNSGRNEAAQLSTIALAANILGPTEMSLGDDGTGGTIGTMQVLIDNGWRPGQLNRPLIHAAHTVLKDWAAQAPDPTRPREMPVRDIQNKIRELIENRKWFPGRSDGMPTRSP